MTFAYSQSYSQGVDDICRLALKVAIFPHLLSYLKFTRISLTQHSGCKPNVHEFGDRVTRCFDFDWGGVVLRRIN